MAASPPADSVNPPAPAVAVPGFFLAFSAAAAILALRAPDALTLPQFWAEDGAVFFTQQYGRLLPPLFEPYAGYLLVFGRLVAWLASLFSNVHAPLIYAVATILAGAGAIAALRRLPLPADAFWMMLAALALTPTNVEVYGNLTNAQWMLQFYLLLPMARFIADQPAPRPLMACLPAALVGLTGPFSLFAVAGASCGQVYVAWATGRRPSPTMLLRRHPEMAALVLCALVQLALSRFWPQSDALVVKATPDWIAVGNVVAALQNHVLGEVWMPNVVFCLLTAAVAALAAQIAGSPHSRAFIVALAVFIGLQLWAVAGKHALVRGPIIDLSNGDRYFVLFKVVVWVWLLLALHALLREHSRFGLPVALLLLTTVAVFNADHLRRAPLPDLGWREYAERMDRGEAVEAPVNPGLPWKTVVPASKP